MVYSVPKSKRSLKQNRFEFNIPGDKRVHSIPLAKYLSTGQVEEIAKRGDHVGLIDILAIFDEKDVSKGTPEAVRTLDQEQLEALMQAWQAESGIAVGESSASE